VGDEFGDYGEEYDELFASKGYKADKDYEWIIGYGDDIPNALSVYTVQMLFDEEILSTILDFTGPNCYS
jgi:hypothetical protein